MHMSQLEEYTRLIDSQFEVAREDVAIYEALDSMANAEPDENKKHTLLSLKDVYLLRACCSIVAMDLGTCYVSIPEGSEIFQLYESKFFLKHLKATVAEGYQLICLKDDKKRRSIWYNVGNIIDSLNNADLKSRYDELEQKLDLFRSGCAISRFRNIVFHYDTDPAKVFSQINKIRADEPILTRACDFCKVLDEVIEYTDEIIGVLKNNAAVTIPNVNVPALDKIESQHSELNALNLDNKAIRLFANIISKTVVHVTETNMMYNGLVEFNNLYSKLPDIPEVGFVKPKFEEADFSMASLSMYLYVYYATIDIATLLSAYFTSTSYVQKVLILRKVHVCALAILQKVYVQDETTKQLTDGYWKTIKDELAKAEGYSFDTATIDQNLLSLNDRILTNFERHVFVHYYKGHHPEITTFMHKLETMNPKLEVGKAFMFLITLQNIQECLYGLLLNRAESLDRTTKENYEKLKSDWIKTKEQIANIEEETYKSKMERLATEFERQINEMNKE